MKAYKQSEIIEDVATNWRKMQGSSVLEKKINAFLTSFFVTGTAPKDECIMLAQRILNIKKPTREKIRAQLKKSFGEGVCFDADTGTRTKIDLDTGRTAEALDKGALVVHQFIKFS